MKKHIFNVQSKGGSGKSMLTYFQALKNQNNERTVFIDLDSSARTSTQQLGFLKVTERLLQIDITDQLKRPEREKMFDTIEALNGMDFDEFYYDFGAPESEQFPLIFDFDFSAKDFKEFEKSLGAQFIFNIVIAGGPAFSSCISYAERISIPLNGRFEIFLYLNDFTLHDQKLVASEMESYLKSNSKLIMGIKSYGDIQVERGSGQRIMDNIKGGKGAEGYTNFITKMIIKREIAKV